ncbi:MAG TPA: hypothetical protein VKC61_00510 [Pyrinomonadaceae bacterium]|nr:hypothetical protein [Pyrinomonadaceae bacterium]
MPHGKSDGAAIGIGSKPGIHESGLKRRLSSVTPMRVTQKLGENENQFYGPLDFFSKELDIDRVATIMAVFIARRYMTFSRSADCSFYNQTSHQTPLGAKVNHITHFFRTGD